MIKSKKKLILATAVIVALIGVTTSSITINDFQAGKAVEIFYNVLRTINLDYVDKVDNEKLIRKATDEMLSTLDPYTVFLDENDMEEFKVMTTGKYGGVGSTVKAPRNGGYASISTIYRDFPMHKAGVTPGDTIIAIDGVSMKGLTATEITSKMKGTPGSIVNMQMKKLRTGEVITYPVKREVVRISPVDYYGFVDEQTGYISFNTFSAGGAKDVRNAIEQMQSTGKLKSLILDLRGNGGGLVSEAVEIVSLFVPMGSEVVSMRGRDARDSKVSKTITAPIAENLPLIVLINRSSASASEIVAGALQDRDRAYILGERSFGKGLVQAPRPVGYNSYVKVTIAKYYTPSGRCIQALDYTHRNEDGSVKHIPDSLISEFKSNGGRILYDGGGIMPDSVIAAELMSPFMVSVMLRGYVEDFATDYYKRNAKVASVKDFKLTEKDFADFAAFLSDKEIEFKSKSEDLLSQLRVEATKERSLDMIEKELVALETKYKTRDKVKSIKDNKKDLMEILEYDILAKYYFNEGRSQKISQNDSLVATAKSILKNSKLYSETLKNKSPKKN